MRKVKIGMDRVTEVYSLDEPDLRSGANHQYGIYPKTKDFNLPGLSLVTFQNGPIKEAGINGCHNEDLIAIVIDRLEGFQSSEFACRENAIAKTKLEEALLWLNKRTNDRINRGVEGTHEI